MGPRRRNVVEEENTDEPINIASYGAEHRANVLDDRSQVVASSHQRMARSWPVLCNVFIDILSLAGFHLFRHLDSIVHDPRLLTAMVERWCPRTNTFHLPVGEMTITLQDVALIMGVRISGPALVGPEVVGEGDGMLWATWEDCCDDLLGEHPDADRVYVDPDDPDVTAHFTMGTAETHTCVPLRWLRWVFYRHVYTDLTVHELHHCARAYILYIIGTILLPDTSHSHVSLQYLPLLEDLNDFAQYSVGSSVLGNLYRELALATKPRRRNMAGCLHLLQVWCWERFYIGRPTLYTPTRDVMGMPIAARWNGAARRREQPVCTVAIYRDMIDRLVQSQVAWTPYIDGSLMALLPAEFFDGIEIWTARVPLISWKRVEWHLPDRVMRQFGGSQRMALDPVEWGFRRTDGRGHAGTDWTHYHRNYIGLWNERHQFIRTIDPPEAGAEDRELAIYMEWYQSWAAPLYLTQPTTQAPDTYAPISAEHRMLMDYYIHSSRIADEWGGTSEHSTGVQLAMDSIKAMSLSVREQFYIDPIQSQQMGRGDPGASSSYHPGDRRADDDEEDFQDPPPPRHARERRPPDRHTPGSGAIPPRRRRR